jgi:hypothetical protein
VTNKLANKLWILPFILFSHLAFATSYFVEHVTISDGNAELANSVQSLAMSAVTAAGGKLEESEAQADYTLRTDVVKLGPAYVVTVGRYQHENLVYATKQKAFAIQELDETTEKAVRAAMIGTPTKKDLRVGEVKEHDRRIMTNRIESKNSVYLGFGPANFQNMNISQLAYDLALGYVWGVAPQWDVRALADFVVAGDWRTSLISGLLGLNYFFTDQDSAPYVTGGLGFGVAATNASSATTIGGFAGNIGLGYQLFRTSSTQFDIALTYNSVFGNNTIGSPGFEALRVGILF